MSTTVTNRRKMAPTAHQNNNEIVQEQETEKTIDDADNDVQDSKEEHADDGSNFKTTQSDELKLFRDLVRNSRQTLEYLVKGSWNLPMSRDTIYLFGELKGHYNMILASLERDIYDANE